MGSLTPEQSAYLDRRAAYRARGGKIQHLPRPPGGWRWRPALRIARTTVGALVLMAETPALPLEPACVHLFDPDIGDPQYHVNTSKDLTRELRRRASWDFYLNVRYWRIEAPCRRSSHAEVMAKAWASEQIVLCASERLLERPVYGIEPWDPTTDRLPFWP